jgi:hypothetical protein
VRYNAPPNWPAPPPGWAPTPGWAPDPSWPPPPPGWQFWLPEDGGGGATTARRYPKLPIIIVASILAVGIVAAVVAVIVARSGASKSDEDRIRDVVVAETDAVNRGDVEGFVSTVCAARQAQARRDIERDTKSHEGTSISITNISVNGDTATVHVVVKDPANPDGRQHTDTYVRESGTWKICD